MSTTTTDQPMLSRGLAVAALALGIVGVAIPFTGLVTAPLAIIFGHNWKLAASPERGMALTGFICGIVAASVYAIFLITFIVLLMV